MFPKKIMQKIASSISSEDAIIFLDKKIQKKYAKYFTKMSFATYLNDNITQEDFSKCKTHTTQDIELFKNIRQQGGPATIFLESYEANDKFINLFMSGKRFLFRAVGNFCHNHMSRWPVAILHPVFDWWW